MGRRPENADSELGQISENAAKIIRDHDFMLKNLRQEVNELKDTAEEH